MRIRLIIYLALILLTFNYVSLFPKGRTDELFTTDQIDTNIVLPPSWAFGILYGGYTDQNETIERIKSIIEHDYPIDAYWIDSWFWSYIEEGRGPEKYIDFTGDTIAYPDRKKMWDFMSSKNIKGGFWIWDCIFETGNESVFQDFLSRGFFKNVYLEMGGWHNYSTTTAMYAAGNESIGTKCGNINFNDTNAVNYFRSKVKYFFDEGADFLKLDRTSAIPVCKAMFEITQDFGLETKGRGFVLSHTGGMESDDYAKYPIKWTDDTRSDWSIDKPTKEFDSWVPKVALKENILMFTDSSGETPRIPFLACDMGGYDIGKDTEPDEELFIRWMQFSIFTPIVELFSQPENQTSNLPFNYSERADSLFKYYSHLRMELFPYIYSYAHKRRLENLRMIRSMPDSKLEYLFGNELLIAPVYEKNSMKREVKLPEGIWFDFYNNQIYHANQKISVDAPISKIPVFVKGGSIIPMRGYSSNIDSGSNDTLSLHLYTGGDSDFDLIEDDGSSNDYLTGGFSKTRISFRQFNDSMILKILPVEGKFEGMSKNRTIKLIIHSTGNIKSVELNKNQINFESNDLFFSTEYFEISKTEENVLILK